MTDTVELEDEPTMEPTIEFAIEPTNTPADNIHHTCTCAGNAPLHTGHWPILTRRETETLDLIARGASYTDIATTLGITLDTVKTVMRRIHKKLGARNSPHAVTIALAMGIICAADPED